MRDRHHFQGLSSAVSLGVLAEDVVLATGRLLRGEPLDEQTTEVLARGRELIVSLYDTQKGLGPTLSASRQVSEQATIDALRAIRRQGLEAPTQDYLRSLAELLENPDNVAEDARVQRLDELRRFFAFIGQVALARANGLARPRQEQSSWTTSTSTRALY